MHPCFSWDCRLISAAEVGGALGERCDKWAEPVFARGGFEFLCKCDALRRLRAAQTDQKEQNHTHSCSQSHRRSGQKERGKGKEVKRLWERGEISERTQTPIPICVSSCPSRGSQYVVELRTECGRRCRKREILERRVSSGHGIAPWEGKTLVLWLRGDAFRQKTRRAFTASKPLDVCGDAEKADKKDFPHLNSAVCRSVSV
ncbi:hypothetical protein QQF64_009017 [Cirrhinus molitorella]|uniref:Uncharacterized protein n=1 Tax=Cirrhinus molitorella TaxID=172907 RepID=A0ABR3M991_9TELE